LNLATNELQLEADKESTNWNGLTRVFKFIIN